MLQELRIKNFAVIEELRVSFGERLNVVSGETGAGKSVLITALDLLLGGKSTTDLVRSGAEQMVVEGSFAPLSAALRAKLEAYGVDEEGDSLVLKRRVHCRGKSTCYANGGMVTLGVLDDLGRDLVDIHGQHQHQLLLRTDTHLDFLDAFAGLEQLRGRLEGLYSRWQEGVKKRERLLARREKQAMERELFAFQLQEIEQARLYAGEEDDLRGERKVLQNSGRLLEEGNWVYQALYGAEGAVSEVLAVIDGKLGELGKVDARLGELGERAESLRYQAQDLASAIREYMEGVEFDPARRDEVESRLFFIEGLKRKYGKSVEEILAYKGEIEGRVNDFSHGGRLLRELEEEIEETVRLLVETARLLSEKRRTAAVALEGAMKGELAGLGMTRGVFEVAFIPLDEGGGSYKGDARGLESVEFLFSANPGEGVKPLARVVSGGELSRIMLVLKSLLAGRDRVGTVVFDEVDVGIGGKIAEVVGKKLKASAAVQQVICITHLPQIAALADRHFLVSKRVEAGQTVAGADELDREGRVREVARMLAGAQITPAALEQARYLIGPGAGSGRL